MRMLTKEEDLMFATFGINAAEKARTTPQALWPALAKHLAEGCIPDTYRSSDNGTDGDNKRIFMIGHDAKYPWLMAVWSRNYLIPEVERHQAVGWEQAILEFAQDAKKEKGAELREKAGRSARERAFIFMTAFVLVMIFLSKYLPPEIEGWMLLVLLCGVVALCFSKGSIFSTLWKKDEGAQALDATIKRCADRIKDSHTSNRYSF